MRVIKQPIFTLLLTISLVATHQVSMAQDSENLRFTLDEAIAYALENNQNVKNARLEEEIAERQVGEILADGLPQVNANANLNYNYKIQQTLIESDGNFPPGVPAGETAALEFGIPYTSMFDVGLSQMIFDGSFFIGLEAARTFTQLSKKDHIKTKIDIAEAVSKAYFLVLVNEERVQLIERNFSRLDSLLQDTKVMYVNGFVEKIDVSRIQVQYNNMKVEKDNFKQISDVSLSLLKFQMGLAQGNKLILASTIDEMDQVGEMLTDFSYESRVEFSQMNIRKELNELDIRNIRAKYYPKLNLVANYGRNTGNTSLGDLFSDDWFGVGAIGIKATVPIFDGMRKRRQVQQRQLKAEQIDYSLDLLKSNIDIEIEMAEANYKKGMDMMNAQKENMELSKEVYDVTKVKYNEGVGSNIEVIEADATYKESQINYYNALYDALISKIDLQKAYGILL